jgi:hypothetical protein
VAIALALIQGATSAQSGRTEPAGTAATTFADGTRAAGLAFVNVNGTSADKHLAETMGSGVVLFDFDNDGFIDIFLADGGSLASKEVAARARHRLYRNQANGTFADVSASAGLLHNHYGMGACAGDIDNDGHVDLYVTGVGGNSLFRNRGDGSFADVTARSGAGQSTWSTSCAFADLDRDGDLDLFVTNYLTAPVDRPSFCGNARLGIRQYCHPLNYKPLPNMAFRNDGSGRFTDVSAASGVALAGYGLGVVISDFDDDGWPDVFVANDSVPNYLFFNEGNWRFRESALASGVAVAPDGRPRAGMGTDAADYDGDGLIDLVVTNHEFETHGLYRNAGGRLFTYATTEAGLGAATLPYVGFGVAFLDFDNDTQLDIAIANGHVIDNAPQFRPGATHAQRKLLFRNVTGRRFAEVSRAAGPGFHIEKVGRGLAAGDIDNDGDLDLLLNNNGGAADLLVNESPPINPALLVRLAGTKSNRDAVGARVRVVAGGRTLVREVKAGSSYLSQNDARLHFGLRGAAKVDRLEVTWAPGRREAFEDVAINRIVTIREGEGIVSTVPLRR